MAHLALDRALPASWIDEVFQAHRQRQYLRELLFSSVVALMLLVTLGLRPSLHAAARKMADRHFCTQAIMQGLDARGAGCIVREHARHLRLLRASGPWSPPTDIETGCVREQAIELAEPHAGAAQCWRRMEIALHTPTEAGDEAIVLWSNLPPEVDAATIARLYRKRWRIKGMFQRLESVLHSEIKTLGHPRAALLGFAVAVLAYNVLALLKQFIERAHRHSHPELDVSTYHLAVDIASDYGPMLRMLPPEQLPRANDDPQQLARHLLRLAKRMSPKQLATSKRKPKAAQAKGYVDGSIARSHVSTARVLKQAAGKRP